MIQHPFAQLGNGDSPYPWLLHHAHSLFAIALDRLIATAEPAIRRLRDLTAEELLTELGRRLVAVRTNPVVAGDFHISSDYDVERKSADDLSALGHGFFMNINPQAEALLYGDAGSDECRSRLIDAFAEGHETTAGVLAAALVSEIGLSPVLAPVVGLITLDRFLMRP